MMEINLFFHLQVKSIIENNYIKKEIDPSAVCSFLINGSVKEPATMYKNVKALDAGNYLIIDDGNLQNYSFYNLADHILEVQNTRNEAISEITLFEESLNNTMKRHITSDVPIALYLSSGVDSTSILNALNQVSNDKINTIILVLTIIKIQNMMKFLKRPKFLKILIQDHFFTTKTVRNLGLKNKYFKKYGSAFN